MMCKVTVDYAGERWELKQELEEDPKLVNCTLGGNSFNTHSNSKKHGGPLDCPSATLTGPKEELEHFLAKHGYDPELHPIKVSSSNQL